MGGWYKQKSSHLCGECVHYVLCSKLSVKNAETTTSYCLWEKDYYEKGGKVA